MWEGGREREGGREGGEGCGREGGREREEEKEESVLEGERERERGREGGEGCGREGGKEERDVGGREGRRRGDRLLLLAVLVTSFQCRCVPSFPSLTAPVRMVLALCSLQWLHFLLSLVDSCSLNYKNYINTCS